MHETCELHPNNLEVGDIVDLQNAAVADCISRPEGRNADGVADFFLGQLDVARNFLRAKIVSEQMQQRSHQYTIHGRGKGGVTILRVPSRTQLTPGDFFEVRRQGMRGERETTVGIGTVTAITTGKDGTEFISCTLRPAEIPKQGELRKTSSVKILEFQLRCAQRCSEVLRDDEAIKTIAGDTRLALLAHIPPEEKVQRTKQEIAELLRYVPREILEDPEQLAALTMALQDDPLCLIHGPSGTGKTTVARELVKLWVLREKSKVLVLSHSNQGLDRLLLAIKEAGVKVHRFGSRQEVVQRNLLHDYVYGRLRRPRRTKFTTEHSGFAIGDYRAEMREFARKRDILKQNLKDEFEEHGGCAGVTLNSLPNDFILNQLEKFDYVIVDESTRARLHELLPALEKAKIKVVFIGDHKQLGNMPLSLQEKGWLEKSPREAVDAFEEGPFQTLMESDEFPFPRVMLRTNRRSQDEIVELVSEVGYEGKLKKGRGSGGKIVWLDTRLRDSEVTHEKRVGTSYINVHEATLVARRVKKMLISGTDPKSIGVTSPYSAQVELMKKKLARLLHEHPQMLEAISFQVDSVDAFQGDERDTMFVSLVVTNWKGRIGFLDELRRIRVALSRAKNELYIIGNTESIIDNNPDDESRGAFERAREVIQRVGEHRMLQPNLTRRRKRAA